MEKNPHRRAPGPAPVTRRMRQAPWVLHLLCLTILPGSLSAQSNAVVSGRVIDLETGEPIGAVLLTIQGLETSTTTNQDGRFSLDSVPEGIHVLVLDHLVYGTHRHFLNLAAGEPLQVEIRLTPEAIELEPLLVQTRTSRQAAARASGASVHVVNRDQIERAMGTSRHLGDLIAQTVPGMRITAANSLTGRVCLEFRAAATLSLIGPGCRSPQVFLDGVPMMNPDALYELISLPTIERLEVIPPGEAGARYGTGSLYGVLLIETRTPGIPRGDSPTFVRVVQKGSRTFDWSQDAFGHHSIRSAAGAVLGNAVGLAAGLAVASRCFSQTRTDEFVTTCGSVGVFGSALLALALPTLGSSLGARWGGTTDTSRGDLMPMLLGTGLVVFPGYVFSLSRGGEEGNNVDHVGTALLVIGVPAMATLGDYLFRKLRN